MARVLIADDNDDTRDMLRAALQAAPFEVELVKTGEEALAAYRDAKAKSAPYDLLVLDAAMEDLSGYRVAETLRKEGDFAAEIVVYTAFDDIHNCARARRAGIRKIWEKPNERALLDLINEELEKISEER